MLVRIRDTEGCEPQPNLNWDSVWVQRLDASGGYADWILAGPMDQPESRGGLRSEAALHSATLMLLFTDARAPAEATLPGNDSDRRGWWGDSIQLDGEPDAPVGSLIWLEVERGIANEQTALRVKDYAEEALVVLKTQGAVAKTIVETAVAPARGVLAIGVRHFSQAGALVYSQRFGVLWQQSLRNAPMNFGDRFYGGAFVDPVDVGGVGDIVGMFDFSHPDSSGHIIVIGA